MFGYPFLSERTAKAFARNSNLLRESDWADSGPRNRNLADRYRKASEYLYSRIGRPVDGEPVYEMVNDNEPW